MGIHVCDIGLYPTSNDIGEWNVLDIIFMDQTGKWKRQKHFESALMIGLWVLISDAFVIGTILWENILQF